MRYEPSPEEIQRDKLYRNMGLADAEYADCGKTGALPNYTETGLFSVLWSEHCSYKNSKPVLKKFPTEGERVLRVPGKVPVWWISVRESGGVQNRKPQPPFRR